MLLLGRNVPKSILIFDPFTVSTQYDHEIEKWKGQVPDTFLSPSLFREWFYESSQQRWVFSSLYLEMYEQMYRHLLGRNPQEESLAAGLERREAALATLPLFSAKLDSVITNFNSELSFWSGLIQERLSMRLEEK
jgi:hypothetical protein